MKNLVIFLFLNIVAIYSASLIDFSHLNLVTSLESGSTMEKTLMEEITFHNHFDGTIVMEEVKFKFPQEKPIFFIIKSKCKSNVQYTMGIAHPSKFIAIADILRETNLQKEKQMEI